MPAEFRDHHRSVEFDYESIDRDAPCQDAIAKAAEAFECVMDWISSGGRGYRRGVFVRTHVWLWVVRPQAFECCTEKTLAKRLGITPNQVSRHIASFRERFKFKNRLMQSDEHREKRSVAVAKWHEEKFDVPIRKG